MSSITSLLKPAFTALQAVTGDLFSYAGLSGYRGTFDAERRELVFSEMGQREVVQRSCVAIKTQWISKPDPANRPEIVLGSDTYVVTAIGEDGIHYVLTLEKRT